jgi:hypothetical protein
MMFLRRSREREREIRAARVWYNIAESLWKV